MPQLGLHEIGSYSCDGFSFPMIYQVTGLQAGDYCIIGFAGDKQWRLDWFRFNGTILERLPAPDALYKSPQLALEAIRNLLS
jgi:hypothetical protein